MIDEIPACLERLRKFCRRSFEAQMRAPGGPRGAVDCKEGLDPAVDGRIRRVTHGVRVVPPPARMSAEFECCSQRDPPYAAPTKRPKQLQVKRSGPCGDAVHLSGHRDDVNVAAAIEASLLPRAQKTQHLCARRDRDTRNGPQDPSYALRCGSRGFIQFLP